MTLSRRLYGLYLRVGARAARSGLVRRLGGGSISDGIDRVVRRVLQGRPPREATLHGMTLRFPAEGYFGIDLTAGSYEPWTTEVFLRLLRPDSRFVDVGAHVGYYTVLAGMRLRGRGVPDAVYAFEPDPVSFDYLRRNVQANGCEGVVEARLAAVSDRVGDVTLFAARRDRMTNSIFRTPGTTPRGTTVEGTTLDAFFAERGWPRVDLLKVDVEGAEHAVLAGMPLLSARNPDLRMLVEFFPRNLASVGVTPERFFATLGDLGFARVSMILEQLVPLEGEERHRIAADRAGAAFVNLLCEKSP